MILRTDTIIHTIALEGELSVGNVDDESLLILKDMKEELNEGRYTIDFREF